MLLLGGSSGDQIFLGDHSELGTIANAGGNYIRNVMTQGPLEGNPMPWRQLSNGDYDLNQWNSDYWDRFSSFLQKAKQRDIIVHVTLWDAWDFFRRDNTNSWDQHPLNPANNINYTAAETTVGGNWTQYERREEIPIFLTVPELNNDSIVLGYQKDFVNKVLSYTNQYDNILINLNNEDPMPEAWGDFWDGFVSSRTNAPITNMRDEWNILDQTHHRAANRYEYVDFSQNSHNARDRGGQYQFDRLMQARDFVGNKPINHIKVYGCDGCRLGARTDRGAQNAWFRNIFSGSASSRFHRVGGNYGLGITQKA